MADVGHAETDRRLKKMEKKIHAEYKQASEEVQGKLDDYLRRFQTKDEIKREKVQTGEITQDEYTKWRYGQVMIGKRWEEMRDTLAQDLTNTDKIAMSMVKGYMPDVYALNHNYGTFEAEKGSMIDTSYTLYDRQTVENLMKKNPDLLPKPSVDTPKDLRWNKQHITSAITQGILQGEDIRKISKRLQGVTDMDRRAAIRNARTMTTCAENAGRSDSYTRAREMGIEMEQVWLATLDERTRDSHRQLDGEKIEVGDKWHHPKFSNGLRYPGDPEGPPAEVYNCRCTLIAQVAGVDMNVSDLSERNNYKLGGMSYEEWKEEHQQRADARTARAQKSEQTADTANTIINGKDISATWKRRPDQFDFEIEDVINAQGFDGKPRVVPAGEFDRYVNESNFIAQRTYSAPDQETLDAYRNQLYNGKWYVDCSTGGAAYGQGMYCAADYTGTLTDGIKAEMQYYYNQYVGTLGHEVSEDEWLKKASPLLDKYGVDKSKYNEIARAYIDENDSLFERLTGDLSDSKRDDLYEELYNKAKTRAVYNYVETFTLDPSAKVITYGELMDIQTGNLSLDYKTNAMNDIIKKSNYTDDEATYIRFNLNTGVTWNEVSAAAGRLTNERIQELNKEFPKIGEEATKRYNEEHARRIERATMLQHKFSDPGSLAAALGYDAINAGGHGQSGSYTVILNRTKCIFKGERS